MLKGSDLQEIQRYITTELSCRPNMLVGCLRQNGLQWETDADTTWRMVRGNAILNLLGFKLQIAYPLGIFDVFIKKGYKPSEIYVLQFRGGRWKSWWTEDAQMIGAIVDTYTDYTVAGILLFQELEGVLTLSLIEPAPNAQTLVEEALKAFHTKPIERIRKDSSRGRAWCQHCSVRSHCERIDMEFGQTTDWPKR